MKRYKVVVKQMKSRGFNKRTIRIYLQEVGLSKRDAKKLVSL